MNGNALKFRRSIEKHRIVGFDTAPLIYYIEDVAPYAGLLEPAFELLASHRLPFVTLDRRLGHAAKKEGFSVLGV